MNQNVRSFEEISYPYYEKNPRNRLVKLFSPQNVSVVLKNPVRCSQSSSSGGYLSEVSSGENHSSGVIYTGLVCRGALLMTERKG